MSGIFVGVVMVIVTILAVHTLALVFDITGNPFDGLFWLISRLINNFKTMLRNMKRKVIH